MYLQWMPAETEAVLSVQVPRLDAATCQSHAASLLLVSQSEQSLSLSTVQPELS